MKKVHFISIGGAVMHNMALAMLTNGFEVTGSDDEIFDPSLGRLKEAGIAPQLFGWFPEKIHTNLDFVILGMHARAENPELKKAQEMGIKIFSFPEYVYEHSKEKIRIVIGGSHGKTSTTAMVMHVLNGLNLDFDYLVGSQLEGFDTMVRFSDAPLMIIEGDEYLTSALDRVPKFHKYFPHLAVITGIAHDHANVFPTEDIYIEQFNIFIQQMSEENTLIYFDEDSHLNRLIHNASCELIPYNTPKHKIVDGKTSIVFEGAEFPVSIFGNHNLQNLLAAGLVCEKLDIPLSQFYSAVETFSGAARRLEFLGEKNGSLVYRDFAHAPSKLQATLEAVKQQYPDKRVVAFYELHTFSSLKREFIPQYKHTMKAADEAVVYFNPEVFEHKKLEPLKLDEVESAFENIQAVSDNRILLSMVTSSYKPGNVVLLMSSGNFGGIQLD